MAFDSAVIMPTWTAVGIWPSLDLELRMQPLTFTGSNPCENNNGGCSDICTPGPGGQAECACPDQSDMKLGNGGKMCVPIQNNCTEDQFVCRSGKCVSPNVKCDLDDDCGDGTDENPIMCG